LFDHDLIIVTVFQTWSKHDSGCWTRSKRSLWHPAQVVPSQLEPGTLFQMIRSLISWFVKKWKSMIIIMTQNESMIRNDFVDSRTSKHQWNPDKTCSRSKGDKAGFWHGFTHFRPEKLRLSKDKLGNHGMSCLSCSSRVLDLDQNFVNKMNLKDAAFPPIRFRARKRTLLMSWAVNSINESVS